MKEFENYSKEELIEVIRVWRDSSIENFSQVIRLAVKTDKLNDELERTEKRAGDNMMKGIWIGGISALIGMGLGDMISKKRKAK